MDSNWRSEVIADKFGIPVNRQKLEFAGKSLCTKKQRSLASYGLADDSTVIVSGKLAGGCGESAGCNLCGCGCGESCGCTVL